MGPRSAKLRRPAVTLGQLAPVIGLVALVAVFSIMRPSTFPTTANLLIILNQASLLGMVAGGLTIALILGQFDLSIGFTASLGGIVATQWLDVVSVPVAVLLGIAAGLAVGLVNGILVAYVHVSAFIGTLGMGAIITGVILRITGGRANTGLSADFTAIGRTELLGVPMLVWISAAVLFLLWLFVGRTEAGRRLDATGGNYEAARLAGINARRYVAVGFVVSGCVAALAGTLAAARLGSAYPSAGDAYLLDAYTACFIGAVTYRRNEFHVGGTVVGVLILATVFNGLAQLGVEAYWQNIVKGGILIASVAAAGMSERLPSIRLRRRPEVPTQDTIPARVNI